MRALHLVSGPPGAGKSTVARLLATREARGVHLHADDFWHYIASGFVPPWLPASAEQNAVVMSAVVAAAVRFTDGGYATFVDGVIGPWFLEPFERATRETEARLDYVVLRPTEDVAVERALARGERGLADEAAIRKLHREFSDLGDLEGHVVDTSDMAPDDVVAEIERGFADGRFSI